MKYKINTVFLFFILLIFSSCSEKSHFSENEWGMVQSNISSQDTTDQVFEKEAVINYNETPYYGFNEKELDNPNDISDIINTYRTASNNPDFVICDYENGVCIVEYKGTDKNIIIPETLEGKPVIKLGGHYSKKFSDSYEFLTALNCYNAKSVSLPSSLKYIVNGSFHSTNEDELETIIVSNKNQYYTSINGVLYNKKKTILLAIPANYQDKEFNILNGTKIAYEIFSNNTESINIPSSLENININSNYPAWYYNSDLLWNNVLESINVDKDNNYFSSMDGVLYNKDMTELMIYPYNKADSEFTVPDSVEKIDYFQINDIKNLSTITFGKNIKTIEAYTNFDYDVAFQKKPGSLTVKGYRNTTAEKWCKEQMITWTDERFLIFVELD